MPDLLSQFSPMTSSRLSIIIHDTRRIEESLQQGSVNLTIPENREFRRVCARIKREEWRRKGRCISRKEGNEESR